MPMSTSHRTHEIEEIDSKLSELRNIANKYRKEYLHLLCCRNTVVPVSQLPPEVLSKIFSYNVWYDWELQFDAADAMKPRVPANLIACSQVCRYWRGVTLGDGMIWTIAMNLIQGHPKWVEESLVRSKQAPLRVSANLSIPTPPTVNSMDNLQRALDHISRICELDVVTTHPSQLLGIAGRIDTSSPALESMKVCHVDHLHWSHRSLRGDEVAEMPDSFFDLRLPRLRCLELWHCGMSWNSPLLRNLTHLEVRHQRHTEGPHLLVGVSQVLDALSNLGELKHLSLHNVIPPSSVFSHREIPLHRLFFLELVRDNATSLDLLHKLSFPSTTAVSLGFQLLNTDASDSIGDLLARLPCKLHVHTSLIQGMKIHGHTRPILRREHKSYYQFVVSGYIQLSDHSECGYKPLVTSERPQCQLSVNFFSVGVSWAVLSETWLPV